MRPLPLLLLLAVAGVQAQTYRWTDSAGRAVISDTPPPASARSQATTTGGAPAAADGQSYATRRAAENFPVTLYTEPSCQATCQQARDLLGGRGVPYAEKVVQKPADAEELKALVGDLFVPALKVGRQSFRGFAAAPWHDLLDAAGYPKSAPAARTTP